MTDEMVLLLRNVHTNNNAFWVQRYNQQFSKHSHFHDALSLPAFALTFRCSYLPLKTETLWNTDCLLGEARKQFLWHQIHSRHKTSIIYPSPQMIQSLLLWLFRTSERQSCHLPWYVLLNGLDNESLQASLSSLWQERFLQGVLQSRACIRGSGLSSGLVYHCPAYGKGSKMGELHSWTWIVCTPLIF